MRNVFSEVFDLLSLLGDYKYDGCIWSANTIVAKNVTKSDGLGVSHYRGDTDVIGMYNLFRDLSRDYIFNDVSFAAMPYGIGTEIVNGTWRDRFKKEPSMDKNGFRCASAGLEGSSKVNVKFSPNDPTKVYITISDDDTPMWLGVVYKDGGGILRALMVERVLQERDVIGEIVEDCRSMMTCLSPLSIDDMSWYVESGGTEYCLCREEEGCKVSFEFSSAEDKIILYLHNYLTSMYYKCNATVCDLPIEMINDLETYMDIKKLGCSTNVDQHGFNTLKFNWGTTLSITLRYNFDVYPDEVYISMNIVDNDECVISAVATKNDDGIYVINKCVRNHNNKVRLLIFGSRDCIDIRRVSDICQSIISDKFNADATVEVVTGNARGADSCGELWALSCGHRISRFKPDWTVFGKRAGMIRNKEMLDYLMSTGTECSTYAIGFWDYRSPGTKNMLGLLRDACIPYSVVNINDWTVTNE